MPQNKIAFGEPCWLLQSDCVQASIAHTGAQAAPVVFHSAQGDLQPYYISPWQTETRKPEDRSVLAVLRGEFFCLPFGYAEPSLGVQAHGNTACRPWTFDRASSQDGLHTLRIRMDNALLGATATRQFFLKDGQSVLYCLTTVEGLEGEFPLGHHAILRMPSQERALLVSTSSIACGLTFPGAFAEPENPSAQTLAPAAAFSQLAQVPSAAHDGNTIDCSSFPTRPGSSDLLQIALQSDPGQPAWTAAVNTEENYLWFSLRNPALLPSTVLWIENCGRQSFPWNGRNCSLGLEDVCAYFDLGAEASRHPNAFSRQGIRTVQSFCKDRPFYLPYLQGVLRVPPGFGRVQSAICTPTSVTFTDVHGNQATAQADTGFVLGKPSSLDSLLSPAFLRA
ncbi:MAG: hypothetical protein P4K83_03485 [Terracidiphilus sp.]|nr:hypothetical protein [Terracidiphilus sp.]